MDRAEHHRSGITAAPLSAADSDPLAVHLAAAHVVLRRVHCELRSQSFIAPAHAGTVMRSIAIDVETALSKVNAALALLRVQL